MKLEELKGKLVLFKFADDIRDDLPLFQIYNEELWAVVTEVDNFGVWIENPAYELGIWWDEKGNMVPASRQKPEKFKTNILIGWGHIKALMCVDDERFKRVQSEQLPGFQSYR